MPARWRDSAEKFAAVVESQAQTKTASDFDCPLVWSDEFEIEGLPNIPPKDNTTSASKYWDNRESSQYYTDSRAKNARVQDGRFVMEARPEKGKGRRHTAARLISSQEWIYGRLEVSDRPTIFTLPNERLHDPNAWK